MEIRPKPSTVKGPADWFTGDVWIDGIVEPQGASRLNVAAVHFTPGARTAWHSHEGGRPFTSPKDAASSNRGAKRSSRSALAIRSGPPTVRSTGTALPMTTSWRISRSPNVRQPGATT